MTTVKLKRNPLGRWVITDAANPLRAWSGSQWVGVDYAGLPISNIQVSNLDDEKEAREYAELFEFAVVE